MKLQAYAAGLCAAVIAMTALALPCADAQTYQTKKKRYVYTTVRDANGRVRTRVVVEPRSFLDAGTEVKPGERKFTDYAFPPTYSPMDIIDNRAGFHRSPLPGPFDLPSNSNPYGW